MFRLEYRKRMVYGSVYNRIGVTYDENPMDEPLDGTSLDFPLNMY